MEGIETEIIIAIISAIFGGVITYITSLILEKRKKKEKKE
jgi:hypothetical protein